MTKKKKSKNASTPPNATNNSSSSKLPKSQNIDENSSPNEKNTIQSSNRVLRVRSAEWFDPSQNLKKPIELKELRQIRFPDQPKKQKKKKNKKNFLSFIFCDFCFVLQVSVALLLLGAWIAKERLDPEDRLVGKIIQNEIISNIVPAPTEKPGTIIAKEGLRAKHPVVFVPGIISTGLEVWDAKPCAKKHFRQRFWGTSLMIQKVLLSKECWLDHICLNHTTWLDPDGIKLRSASGLAAADYLVGEYWVWGKVIENLAEVGYDERNMYMGSYDWRLPFKYLEERDHYFTRLKTNIELLLKTNNNQKVVVITHSMGALVFQYFMKWVESPNGGNGGPLWMNDHVEAFVNIAGAMLGVPKTISSVLSGEMRDTAELNSVLQFIKENLMSKTDMLSMFRSFGSMPSLFPKGGNAIWGNGTYTPENLTLSHMLTFIKEDESHKGKAETKQFDEIKEKQGDIQELSSCVPSSTTADGRIEQTVIDAAVKSRIGTVNYTVEDSYQLLREVAPEYMSRVDAMYSWGISRNLTDPKYSHDQRYWANPLETPLPNAPNMKIYCLYGVGKDTERAYYYEQNKDQCSNIPVSINTKLYDKESKVSFGVQLAEGDGTVPLMSLGYMCVKGWKDPIYNPSNMKVVTREYHHTLQSLLEATVVGLDSAIRGGITTADHVDIMGNHQLLEDMLRIATGDTAADSNRILSKIVEYSDRVVLD